MAEYTASLATAHPVYGHLAGRLALMNINKVAPKHFSDVVDLLSKQGELLGTTEPSICDWSITLIPSKTYLE